VPKQEEERERERERRKRIEQSLNVGGQAERSTRSIRMLDRGSMLAVELSTGSVDSLNNQDAGNSAGTPRNSLGKRTRDVSLTHLMTLPG